MSSFQSGTLGKVGGVVNEIREAFGPVLAEIGGRAPRASALARDLGVDQTLTARLLRALRPPDITSVIHEVPSPEGLRIILAAAGRAGLSEASSERAHRAVREFERIISEFPGGRSGLNAAFAGMSPATRDHTEGAAKQSIFKSMSMLLGYCCDVSQATYFIRRSPDNPRFTETAYVLGKYNVRRLRPSHAITVFGISHSQVDVGDPINNIRTLDGRPATKFEDFLLMDHCSRPLPHLETVRTGTTALTFMPEGVPAINDAVSLVSGQWSPRSSDLESGGIYSDEAYTPRMPSKSLVMDAVVEDGLFAGPPILSTTMASIGGASVPPESSAFKLDEVSLQAPVQFVPRGFEQIATPEIPGYTDLVGSAFESLGWDRTRFVGYRTVVRYPVPFVHLAYWFPRHAG